MKTSYLVLRSCAVNERFWSDYCNDIKPKRWVQYDSDGRVRRRRRSPRLADRSNERSLNREELRRQLIGRPAPYDVPEGEVHVYTDGSASLRRGRWGAGSGVWFGEQSPYNISTIPPGRQTVNRAELTTIILKVRKVMV